MASVEITCAHFRMVFQRKPLVLAFLTVIGAFVAATLLLVAAGLRDQIGHADVAMVLGSKVNADGTPSSRLRARLDRTLGLYQAGYFPTIIVSGGADEAVVMGDYLRAHGVPANHIVEDKTGVNTFASAHDTLIIMRHLKLHSVLVVSQYFHVPRALLALERFGINPVYSAHAQFFELRDLYSSPRELAGYIRYYFRSYTTPDLAGLQPQVSE
jgi:vancomycin permeability regulator SanA